MSKKMMTTTRQAVLPRSNSTSSSYQLIDRNDESQNLRRRSLQDNGTAAPETNISNDENDLDPMTLALSNGYIYEYSCERLIGADVPQSTIAIYYDYEYTALALGTELANVDDGVNPTLPSTLPAIEWGTLWTVANQLGLHGCYIDSHPVYVRLNDNGDEIAEHIVALSSLPVDTVDPAGCEFLPRMYDMSSDERCHAIRGMLTANFTGVDGDAVDDFLQSVIRVQLDAQKVLTGGVTRALYLGKREEYIPPVLPAEIQSGAVVSEVSGNALTTSTVGLISGVSLGAAFTAIFAALFILRHKRRQASSDSSSDEDDKRVFSTEVVNPDEENQAELQSLHSYPQRSTSSMTTIPVSNIEGLARQPDDDSKEEEESKTQNDVNSETSSDSTQDLCVRHDSSDSAQDLAGRVNSSDANSDSAVVEEKNELALSVPPQQSKLVDVLPPLPPNKPSKQPPPPAQQSKTMRRRRKRKKKKKPKKTITRVNSRENIKEMETIEEVVEEVNGDSSDDDDDEGSDFGSEYSWSTDGDDSDRPSRDPSPVRSVHSEPSGHGTTAPQQSPSLSRKISRGVEL